ncbi:hypothetical protein RND71_032841 [Anisodus tanguticus]|uniref:Uncharacterized protein n=1 Tax=Anisodus tanguticus TaxID=243964 RepID=A0AAE1RA15_9SOLA|nr:hypothetical protein RND71_032841 [Anisodus tanguticus]
MCYHSYPMYLKELCHPPASLDLQPFRLIHDLISREGPFLETACIPIAGLTILLWPLVVIGSVIMAIFSSFFIGLYGAVIVYQERSFQRGVAFVVAMVVEFDEYTNDWLYLREGSILPNQASLSKKQGIQFVRALCETKRFSIQNRLNSIFAEAPAMLVPSLTSSRSVRKAIQEVKMALDKLLDWFFQPVMVLKEQIRVLSLEEGEMRFLENVVLLESNSERFMSWENGSMAPQDSLRAAQIEGISRRMVGMIRSVSKFPTYRRKFRDSEDIDHAVFHFQRRVKHIPEIGIPESVSPHAIFTVSDTVLRERAICEDENFSRLRLQCCIMFFYCDC